MADIPQLDGRRVSLIRADAPQIVDLQVDYFPLLETVGRVQLGGQDYRAVDGLGDDSGNWLSLPDSQGFSFMVSEGFYIQQLNVHSVRPDGSKLERVFG